MAYGGNTTQAQPGAVATWAPAVPGGNGTAPGPAPLLLCPNASAGSQWLWHVLGECPDGSRDYASVAFALLSIICFLLAMLPQLYESYRSGKADQALSIWFLLAWLGGDCSNLIGCILTNQPHLQTLMAVDYVMMDNLVMSQYLYYRVRNRNGDAGCLQWSCVCWMLSCTLLALLLPFLLFWHHPLLEAPALGTNSSRALAHASKLPSLGWMELVGYTSGSASAAFYLGGRLPQLYRNYKRHSVEGVSLALFMLTILGNSTYGTSLVLKAPRPGETEGQAIVAHLPWLIGSFGTLLLDSSMVAQFVRYRRRHGGRPEGEDTIPLRLDEREGAPLLTGWGDE
ncbi:lysosomal amino acid transporter 1 homolog isoform X1 [Lampetra fluviatilis]